MRKAVSIYLLLIALPTVLVALGGLWLLREEENKLKETERTFRAQSGQRLAARAQNELLDTVRQLTRQFPAKDNQLVRNAFKWTRKEGLVEPLRDTATREGLDFLNRFSGFLTARQPWLKRDAPEEGWKATDHGPYGELLYWRRMDSDTVIGFELRMKVVEAALPPEAPFVADVRPVRLIGGCLVALLVLSLVGGGATLLLLAHAARRESRRKTVVITAVAHELRTPLANVQLYSEIVKERRYESDAERDEALDAVADESRRLVEIVLDKALFGVIEGVDEDGGHHA